MFILTIAIIIVRWDENIHGNIILIIYNDNNNDNIFCINKIPVILFIKIIK